LSVAQFDCRAGLKAHAWRGNHNKVLYLSKLQWFFIASPASGSAIVCDIETTRVALHARSPGKRVDKEKPKQWTTPLCFHGVTCTN
jgi:hypothetical protein